jgi:cytochrome P450
MARSPHSILVSDPAAYARGVPHDEFARLRQAGPIVWVDEVPLWRHSGEHGQMVSGAGYWAVTRHAAIVSISRQPALFSSAARGAFLADPKSREDLERTRQLLINMDAPEHTRLRQAVTSAFTPALVNNLRASIRAHAAELVQRMLDRESFDVVRDVAAELPLLVLADLLGIPYADRELLYQWSNQLVGFDDAEYGGGNVERYQRAYAEAYQYATDVARVRRRQPGDDLVSQLLQSAGVPLSDLEMCHLWVLLVVGGNESTRHLLSGALQALCEWPDERRRLAGAADLTATAVEELLRWISPVMQFRRTLTCDASFEGRRLSEGDKVVLYYVSANRDPDAFDAPERLDFGRPRNAHLAFGVGPHFCLGARLARLEAAELLDALRPHLPRLELTGPAVRLSSNFMNGIKSLPARLVPASS